MRKQQPGFVLDEIYYQHDPGSRHPESPQRLKAIQKALESTGALGRWRRLEARPAQVEELELVHHASLIEHVERACQYAPLYLDNDTGVSKQSYRTALFAAGGVLECVDALCSGRLRRAFAFVRPPGHHAEPERAMGFCLFNNVALAAAYARLEHRLERVAVVDIDLHHGNGTQSCFYDNPHVLFISSHQYPFYPGSGASSEVGTKEGTGYTVNFPLPAGTGNRTFVPIYSNIVAPILEQYRPQLILVSAGFDSHFRDPLGGLEVTTAGYASVAASLIRAAERCCEGKICFALEGGYDLQALTECVQAVIHEMEAEKPKELNIDGGVLFSRLSEQARRGIGHFWKW